MATNTPYCRIQSAKIAAGTNNIPVAYDATAGSKVLTSMGLPKHFDALYVYNNTAVDVYIRPASKDDGIPLSDDSDTQEIRIKAGDRIQFNTIMLLDQIFVRSAGSAISSGTFEITAFGK